MLIERLHTRLVADMLKVFPVVAVVGARQVGKSTLVQLPGVGQDRVYFTLDDIAVLATAEKDPRGLLQSAPRVTIDEVQRAPRLLMAIKREVDEHRVPGRFLLTGSADLSTLADMSRILAGRVGIVRLPPLTWKERSGRLGPARWLRWVEARSIAPVIDDLRRDRPVRWDFGVVLAGGYPPAWTASTPESRAAWFEGYRRTYLERDVRQVSQIGHMTDFARLLELAASRTGQILNQASLARDAGLSAATAGRYFSLMEATFQIHRVAPHFRNVGILSTGPRALLADTRGARGGWSHLRRTEAPSL